MSKFNTQHMPTELKPSKLERLAILNKMFKFSFMLAIGVIVLPLTYLLIPGRGSIEFIFRTGLVWVAIILADNYMGSVRKAYLEKLTKHVIEIAAQQVEPEEDTNK